MSKPTNKIAISFDIEDWYHVPVVTGYSFSYFRTVEDFFRNWTERYDYLTEPFKKTIDFLRKKNINATFFIVTDVLDKYPIIAKILKESKHEIACHSCHHQIPVNVKTGELLQSKEDWQAELVEAKKKLEHFFEKEVIGYRAPAAYLTDWMLDLISKSGFKYDSSISNNSLYNKTNANLKNVPTCPYNIDSKTFQINNKNEGMVELPFSYYKFLNLRLPMGGAFFYRLLGNVYFKQGLNQCLKKGDTMFYIHPLDFSNESFPLHNNYKRPLYWVNKGDATLNKLNKLVDYYADNWTTCEDVYNRFSNKN
ncbi:MAG: polysaccharide deacetylase family protein [Bacteroidales bacterium]|nr:polysaccharide deacetylase family protein [Bacteroidales bacterium]